MLLIGVKGHAGMSLRQNFGKGKPKRVHSHMEKKSSRKAFKRWKKAPPPPTRQRSKKAST